MPRLLRQLNHKEDTLVGYIPAQFQTMALMCKKQISCLVFLSIGKSVPLNVESNETFKDIKEKVCGLFGINYQRFGEDILGFFEVMNFENEGLT